jgi:hypothetical protein
MADDSVEIPAESEFFDPHGACVYIAWRADGSCWKVGSSPRGNVCARIGNLVRDYPPECTTRIEIKRCQSYKHAYAVEGALRKKYNPICG